MYYRLKDELLCQDCKIDLKFEKRTGHGYFDAVCVACGHRYEIEIFTKPKGKSYEARMGKQKPCTGDQVF